MIQYQSEFSNANHVLAVNGLIMLYLVCYFHFRHCTWITNVQYMFFCLEACASLFNYFYFYCNSKPIFWSVGSNESQINAHYCGSIVLSNSANSCTWTELYVLWGLNLGYHGDSLSQPLVYSTMDILCSDISRLKSWLWGNHCHQ